jgi:hypothetical protein
MHRPLAAALVLVAILASPFRVARADNMDGMHNDAPMPHMALSAQRAPKPGDARRAAAIVKTARAVMTRYTNVAAAERDGYAKVLPMLKLPMEHYTNAAIAVKAARGQFDPEDGPRLAARKRSEEAMVGRRSERPRRDGRRHAHVARAR